MATNKKRKKKAEVMAEDGSMTLTGHLKELRNRLIICAVVFVVGVVVSLAYADRLIDLLTAMGRDYYQFVSIAPSGTNFGSAVITMRPLPLCGSSSFARSRR